METRFVRKILCLAVALGFVISWQASSWAQGTSSDYYAILGVGHEFSEKELKSSYRRLALKYHPDRNPGDKVAEERFKEISVAYAVLSDPEKRQRYDRGEMGPADLASVFDGFIERMKKKGGIWDDILSKITDGEDQVVKSLQERMNSLGKAQEKIASNRKMYREILSDRDAPESEKRYARRYLSDPDYEPRSYTACALTVLGTNDFPRIIRSMGAFFSGSSRYVSPATEEELRNGKAAFARSILSKSVLTSSSRAAVYNLQDEKPAPNFAQRWQNMETIASYLPIEERASPEFLRKLFGNIRLKFSADAQDIFDQALMHALFLIDGKEAAASIKESGAIAYGATYTLDEVLFKLARAYPDLDFSDTRLSELTQKQSEVGQRFVNFLKKRPGPRSLEILARVGSSKTQPAWVAEKAWEAGREMMETVTDRDAKLQFQKAFAPATQAKPSFGARIKTICLTSLEFLFK